MTSSECLSMKRKYEGVKTKIQGVLGYFDDCSSSILETSSFLQELIISGKTFDDDKLKNDNTSLENSKNDLQSIIGECNEKIEYYQQEYDKALARERERERQLANTSSSSKSDSGSGGASVKANANIRVDRM